MSFKKWFSENVVELPIKEDGAQNVQNQNNFNQAVNPVNTQVVFQAPVNNQSVAPATSTLGADQEIMLKFIEHFQKIFADANMPGPDYFEFSSMKNTQAMAVIPESTRFSACFHALSVQGLTKQRLLDTAEQYVKVLDADSVEFYSQLEAKYKETVVKMNEEAVNLADLITTSAKQIEELNKTIADATARKQQLSVDISNQEQSLKTKKTYYDFALNQMKQTISEDLNKVNQYIQ